MGSRRLKPAQSAAIAKDEIRLGHITGVFGLVGEVRLFLYNPESDLFGGRGRDVVIVGPEGTRRDVSVQARSGAGKRILGRVSQVQTPEAARQLVGWEIVLAEASLPQTEDDEFYHHELIGLPVKSESGEAMGRLTAIHTGPDTDIWIVSGPQGQAMIPAVKELVLSVDRVEGVTVVDGAGRVL